MFLAAHSHSNLSHNLNGIQQRHNGRQAPMFSCAFCGLGIPWILHSDHLEILPVCPAPPDNLSAHLAPPCCPPLAPKRPVARPGHCPARAFCAPTACAWPHTDRRT